MLAHVWEYGFEDRWSALMAVLLYMLLCQGTVDNVGPLLLLFRAKKVDETLPLPNLRCPLGCVLYACESGGLVKPVQPSTRRKQSTLRCAQSPFKAPPAWSCLALHAAAG